APGNSAASPDAETARASPAARCFFAGFFFRSRYRDEPPPNSEAAHRSIHRAQSGKAIGEARQRNRNADAGFLGLENNEDRGLPGLELLDQLVLDGDLRIAGKGVTAQEGGVADVGAVHLEADAGRQQNADGRE